MATDRQVAFMRRLTTERLACAQDGTPDPEGRTVAAVMALLPPEKLDAYWAAIEAAPSGEVSAKIERLLKAPRLVVAQPESNVPAGHYAVTSATGHNDLDFYRVDRPTEGRWAGYLFVKRVIGGHPDTPIRGTEQAEALARIEGAGIAEARARYGQEIGRCGVCNRSLTDEVSRARGIGPDCWSRLASAGEAA